MIGENQHRHFIKNGMKGKTNSRCQGAAELQGEDGAGVVAGDADAEVGHGVPVGGGGEVVPAGGEAEAVVGFVVAAGAAADGAWRGERGEEVGL